MHHTRISAMMFVALFALSCSSGDDGPELRRLANLRLQGGLTDVWGYVDSNTAREYAIVGFGGFLPGENPNSGFYIVDVSDARNPEQVAVITSVPGFDVKVWQNYVYCVDGGGVQPGAIVDISDVSAPVAVGSFRSSHNIFISADGFMYLETQFQPLRIYDLNDDPENPRLIWQGGTDGHDAAVIDNRWYDFGAFGTTNIFDVTNPANPLLLAAINSPDISFHHSGWPTEDGNFLFICDELADREQRPSDFTVWDISDLDDPTMVGGFSDPTATVHNLYVIGDFAYVSYYTAGFRIFDVSEPGEPQIVKEFDTSDASGAGFDGAFGVYPFAPSGHILVSDSQSGLHVFSFSELTSDNNANPLAP